MSSAGDTAWRSAALLGLSVWCFVAWNWLRPPSLVADWQGWRQADTQTIAQRFAQPNSTLLYPRIAWGGDGPGYVETELQLYPWLVSRFFRDDKYPEWPGQALSLLFAALAAYSLLRNLTRRFGAPIGALGLASFLSTRGLMHAATSVQPEALCLLCYVVAWFAFERFVERGRSQDIAIYAVFGALAMLVKPTAAHIGISSFLFALLANPQQLRRPRLWVAWALMVGLLALHFWHARNLYLETGNTFGVLSGGDSKIPRLRHLLMPRFQAKALIAATTWGTGVAAALALAALTAWRRLTPELIALFVGSAAWMLLTFRYSSQPTGTHYFVLAAVLGALAVAELAAHGMKVSRFRARAALWVSTGVTLLTSFLNRHVDRLPHDFDAPTLAAGALLARFARADALVVVRSVEPAFDGFWGVPNNYEDPRVFYLSRTRGFPIPGDQLSTEPLARALKAGARFYVEALPHPPNTELDAWLAQNASLRGETSAGGKVFQLGEQGR